MPRLHGWMQDGESSNCWTYGGRTFAAFMYKPGPDFVNAYVRIWPRLGEAGIPDPTAPLGAEHGGMRFENEAAARAYVESWERATG